VNADDAVILLDWCFVIFVLVLLALAGLA